MTEENDWRYTALLVGSNGDRSSREAGSRSAGRRRGGAAAGQSGRALRAGPVRDQEGRSKISSLTMGSPAVQIPRERPAGQVVGSRRPDGRRLGPLWQDSHADARLASWRAVVVESGPRVARRGPCSPCHPSSPSSAGAVNSHFLRVCDYRPSKYSDH